MAFEMYFPKGRFGKICCPVPDAMVPILYQVHDRSNFPKLTWLIDNLYEKPIISPREAQAIADELEVFERVLLTMSLPFPMVELQKLKTFFNAAANQPENIITSNIAS